MCLKKEKSRKRKNEVGRDENREWVLLAQMILVAAFFPGTDVGGGKAFSVGAELTDDFVVREAVVEHLVDVVAEVFGETGDVAAALTGTEMG